MTNEIIEIIMPITIEHIEISISSFQFGSMHIKKLLLEHGPGLLIMENIIRINPMDKKILGTNWLEPLVLDIFRTMQTGFFSLYSCIQNGTLWLRYDRKGTHAITPD